MTGLVQENRRKLVEKIVEAEEYYVQGARAVGLGKPGYVMLPQSAVGFLGSPKQLKGRSRGCSGHPRKGPAAG